jgi:hypothetical protein
VLQEVFDAKSLELRHKTAFDVVVGQVLQNWLFLGKAAVYKAVAESKTYLLLPIDNLL